MKSLILNEEAHCTYKELLWSLTVGSRLHCCVGRESGNLDKDLIIRTIIGDE